MAQIHVAADSIHCTMRLAQRVLLECDHAAANVPKRETIGISASMLKKHDTVQARWRIIAPAVLDIHKYTTATDRFTLHITQAVTDNINH